MDKIEIVEVESFGQLVEHVIITREDGSQLSTPKAIYDAQQEAIKP